MNENQESVYFGAPQQAPQQAPVYQQVPQQQYQQGYQQNPYQQQYQQNPYQQQYQQAPQGYQQQQYQQNPYQQPMQQPMQQGTKCPGKEIAGLVLGINSLVWGILTLFLSWYIVIAIIYGLVAIGTGIAAIVLNQKVHEQATIITGKCVKGKNMGIAGIIIGAVAMVISVILIFVFINLGYGNIAKILSHYSYY